MARRMRVRSGLHRQMEVVADRRYFVDRLDEVAREIVGMRGGEANAADATDAGNRAQQVDKFPPPRRRIAVGIHRLPEQLNFGVAGIGEAARFGQHGIGRAAALWAPGVRNNAVGAGVVAAFDNRDIGANRIVAAGNFGLKSFIRIEIEAHHSASACFELVHQLRELAGSLPSRRRG